MDRMISGGRRWRFRPPGTKSKKNTIARINWKESMNRIYQGRVTKVEVLKAGTKGKLAEWELLPSWEDGLWKHHQLFQDAVNF